MKKKIKVLYEDADVLVIDKPAGLAVHNDAEGRQGYTVADWVLENYPEMKDVGELDEDAVHPGPARPGIVHRLDKDTSGVMLLAKNRRAYKILKKQFEEREVKKVYTALVYGALKNDSGIIDRPIGKHRDDFIANATGSQARGEVREAVTYYRVVKRYKKYSLLELRPKTGRTHQIRVHLKSVSHPIVCDAVYARGQACLPGMERQALHASSIEFVSPEAGVVKVEAPLPTDFSKALANLK